MNVKNKRQTLPESAFFCKLLSGKYPRVLTKNRLKEWLPYHKGISKDGSARANVTKAELTQIYNL